MEKVNLREKLAKIDDCWHPRIVAEFSGMHVKLSRVKGEFEWHYHEDEDELFWILSGRLLMQFRDRDVWLGEGELIVVPKGVEHRPVAPEEVRMALIEPVGTKHTGNVVTDRTRTELEWI